MITFKHGGKMGDCIYSLPTIKALCEKHNDKAVLYLPETTFDGVTNMYSSMRSFLLMQSYIAEVKEYPHIPVYGYQCGDIKIDYDLDDARKQGRKGLIYTVKRYAQQFKVLDLIDLKKPWLVFDHNVHLIKNYTLFNYTGRHITNDQYQQTSRVNWKKIYDSVEGRKLFVGLPDEYDSFKKLIKGDIIYKVPCCIYHLALIVKYAKALYCNQSLCLTLAQGFGIEYYLDVKPGKTNVLAYTKNEHIL